MSYEVYKCIDSGTEFCPCHLAEKGQCIMCSMLQGKEKCECNHWSGVCIYQRYLDNGSEAKGRRKYVDGVIQRKEKIGRELVKYIIKIPKELCSKLQEPGSFVFLRNPADATTYDVPIAVMENNKKKGTISVVIKVIGIKTKHIDDLSTGDRIKVKGPFWNGILGLRYVKDVKDKTVLIIARGIGQAPMILPLKEMYENNNKVITIVDKGAEGVEFVRPYLDRFSHVNMYTSLIDKGRISKEFCEMFKKVVANDNVELVHCDTSDYITKKIMKLIKEVEDDTGREVKLSCCNNFKMCCGEGICGGCTHSRESSTKRMCKYQGDPKDILKGSDL